MHTVIFGQYLIKSILQVINYRNIHPFNVLNSFIYSLKNDHLGNNTDYLKEMEIFALRFSGAI